MKKVTLWGSILIVAMIAVAIFAALQFGEKSPVIAAGSIELASELTEDALGYRTLYITVFDANSPMPMPYGAMRTEIDNDAEGQFFDFLLTKENLQIMNPSSPFPQTLRIKARLDKDGIGGQDQPGDLTGEQNDIAVGSDSVRIQIDKKI